MKPSRVLPSEAKTSVSEPGFAACSVERAGAELAVRSTQVDRRAGHGGARSRSTMKHAEEDPSTVVGALIGAASCAQNDSRANEGF